MDAEIQCDSISIQNIVIVGNARALFNKRKQNDWVPMYDPISWHKRALALNELIFYHPPPYGNLYILSYETFLWMALSFILTVAFGFSSGSIVEYLKREVLAVKSRKMSRVLARFTFRLMQASHTP